MDFYEILGVKKEATESELKKAYYRLARDNHPDKKETDEEKKEATVKIQKINEAYEILSDPDKRKIYDQYGVEGLTSLNTPQGNPFGSGSPFGNSFPFNFNGGNMENIFNMFGQGRQQGPINPNTVRKNKETVFEVRISLRDVYLGLTKKLKVSRKIINKKGSSSKVTDYPESWTPCSTCRGIGIVMRQVQVAPGFISQSQAECEPCSGKGFLLKPDYFMDDASEIITLDIEKGVKNGKMIRFPDLGNCSPGCLPGDLIVVITAVDTENGFTRIEGGNDLLYNKIISLEDSLCGTNFKIKTLDGREVKVSYSDIITPNEKRVVSKEGINGGSLHIHFNIDFPTQIRNKEKLRAVLNASQKESKNSK